MLDALHLGVGTVLAPGTGTPMVKVYVVLD